MTAYVAMLRAVNVGGTGKLPIQELKATCVAEGFAQVATCIASGSVLFVARGTAARVKAAVLAWPRCRGRTKIIATVTDPESCGRS